MYGLDFRNLTSVQKFIQHVQASYNQLDILINNAAQTIHRPPAYYQRVSEAEIQAHTLLDSNTPSFEERYQMVKNVESNPFLICTVEQRMSSEELSMVPAISHAGKLLPIDAPPISSPLFSSQYCLIPVLPSDVLTAGETEKFFPPSVTDEHNEPADLRPHNSWTTTIQETHPIEMLEVQLVNSTVPSLLVSQFTELLAKSVHSDSPHGSFVINVTSTEGQFAAPKYHGHHAHTNMAKAALNMLTRTIAEPMKVRGIFVNSVDTGWVTKMTPGGIQTAQTAAAPLTSADGAARILDPIYSTLNSSSLAPAGKLFKDFQETPW